MQLQFTDKYLAKSSDIASRLLGDEAIIMSTVDSTLFSLNSVGTVIWEAADGKTPLFRIVEDRVCREFDVPAVQAHEDADEFVSILTQAGILLVFDEPVAATVPL